MDLPTQLLVAARLDLAEVRRSRWLLFAATVYALLAAGFILVGLRESTILGFGGMGRVLFSFCHALVVLLPLLALTATGQVVNRARDDGALEFVLGEPMSRGAWFVAVSMVRTVVLVAPLALLMLAMALYGRLAFGEAVPWSFVGRAVAVSSSLLIAFVGAGMAISTLVRDPARAMIWLLVVWAAGVALLDFGLVGLMLEWRVNPRVVFLLAAMNPVQAARMALLSGADHELSVLGPVGFYLGTRVGSAGLFALGVAWPAVLGALCWLAAFGSFRRGDLV